MVQGMDPAMAQQTMAQQTMAQPPQGGAPWMMYPGNAGYYFQAAAASWPYGFQANASGAAPGSVTSCVVGMSSCLTVNLASKCTS